MNREAIGRSGGIHAPSSDHVSTVLPAWSTVFSRPPKPEKCSPAALLNPSATCVTPALPGPAPGSSFAWTAITPEPAGAILTSSSRPSGSLVASRATNDEPSIVALSARVACHHCNPAGVSREPPHGGTGLEPKPNVPAGEARVPGSSTSTVRPPCSNRSCHGSSWATARSGPETTVTARTRAAAEPLKQAAAVMQTAIVKRK